MSEVQVELVAKSKPTKAPVWEHFGFEKGEDGKAKQEEIATCRLCRTPVPAKGGCTSNLLSHLKNHHPLKHSEVRKTTQSKTTGKASTKQAAKQPSVSTMLAQSQKYDRKSRKWQELTDRVTFCLGKDMMPIYSAEKEGFRQLLKSFDPRYELPSRKYFSKTAIPKLYAETREIVEADVKSAEFFAATTDCWSSHTMEPYLSYTVHFIGEDYRLHTRCLQTLFLPESHTGENLAEAIKGTLESWGLDASKQTCLTSDNGKNIVCATVRHLGWTHLSCFCHNLHLAVSNAVKDDRRVS